jgi:hypothetical protein
LCFCALNDRGVGSPVEICGATVSADGNFIDNQCPTTMTFAALTSDMERQGFRFAEIQTKS